MIKLVSVIALVLSLGACAPSEKTLKPIDSEILDLTKNTPFNIINGEDVQPTDPLSASIVGVYDVESSSLCTGSLIAETYVLTAAHCMGSDPKNLRVFFGSSIDHVVAVKKVVAGTIPNYYPSRSNTGVEVPDMGDICLLRIEGKLPPGYAPIQMLTTDLLQNGQEALLAGYGISDGVKRVGSGILRKTVVKIANAKYGASEVTLDQRSGTGACHGDSGGPAYLKTEAGYILWGITSRGYLDDKDDCSQFAIYTNVLPYQGWLVQSSIGLLDQ